MARLGWIFAITGAAVGGFAVGVLVTDNFSSEAMTAVATVVLAVITGAYVLVVHGQLDAMRDQARVSGEQLNEQRELDRQARVRERSEREAWRALEAIYDSGIRPGVGSPESVRDAAPALFRTLEQRAPFIDDAEVRERMRIVGVIVWMMTWSDESLERDKVNPGLLSIHVRRLVELCGWTLQRYLNGEELPSWESYPTERSHAQGWVWDEMRRSNP